MSDPGQFRDALELTDAEIRDRPFEEQIHDGG